MRRTYYAAIVLIVLIMVGCNHYGALSKDFGNSYNAAKSGQILNPGASNNLRPVTGLPGTAVDASMKKYTESFAPTGQAQQGTQGFAMTPIVPTEGAGTGKNVYGK